MSLSHSAFVQWEWRYISHPNVILMLAVSVNRHFIMMGDGVIYGFVWFSYQFEVKTSLVLTSNGLKTRTKTCCYLLDCKLY